MRIVPRLTLAVAVALVAVSLLAGSGHAQTVGGGGITSGNRMIATGTTSTVSFPRTFRVPSAPGIGTMGYPLAWAFSGLWAVQPELSQPRLYLRPSAHAMRERRASR